MQSPPVFPSTHSVLEPAAGFTCRVIESLRDSAGPDGRLLPPGILLNINYPPLPPDRIRGVLYPEVSGGHLIELGYQRCDETGHVIPRYHANVDPARPDREAGDVRAHMEGYVTISPVKPGWNPSREESGPLVERLDGIAHTGTEQPLQPSSSGSKTRPR